MSNQNINTHEQKSLKGTVWINLVEVSSRTVNDWMNELNHLGVGGSPIDLSMIVKFGRKRKGKIVESL